MGTSLPPDQLTYDPFPAIPFTAMPKEQWQSYLEEKLQEHRQGMNPRALLGIQKAVHALGEYEHPSAMRDISSVAGGISDAAQALPGGIATTLGQLGKGNINDAAKGIVGGLEATGKASMAPWELAMRELGGQDVPEDQRQAMLHQGGQAVTGLEAMALPGQISRGIGAIKGSPQAPTTPPVSPTAPPNAPATPAPATPSPATGPTPAGATPAQPMTGVQTGTSQFSGATGETGAINPELMLALGLLGGRMGAGSAALKALKGLNLKGAAGNAGAMTLGGAGMQPAVSPPDTSTGIR